MCGQTESTLFPTAEYDADPYSYNRDSPYIFSQDGYIARFNNSGTEEIWGTYFGATYNDALYGIVVNSNDDIIVCGFGGGSGFPYFDPDGEFADDAYYQYSLLTGGILASFDNLAVPLWITTISGTTSDIVYDVTVDDEDNILCVGATKGDFPVTIDANQDTYGGGLQDGFVAKFTPDFNPSWITYAGGVGGDYLTSIKTDINNNVIIGGYEIPWDDVTGYPTTNTYIGAGDGYIDSYQGGSADGIVCKYDESGSLKIASYVGSENEDHITDITSDGVNLYAIGYNTFGELSTEELSGFYYDDVASDLYNSFLFSLNDEDNRRFMTYFGGTTHGNYGSSIYYADSKLYLAGELYYSSTEECFEPLVDIDGWYSDVPYEYGYGKWDDYISELDLTEWTTSNQTIVLPDENFNVFPNPTNGFISVTTQDCSYEKSVSIYNIEGNLILSRRMNDCNITFDLSKLESGVYVIIIFEDQNNVYSDKIVILK